MGIEENTTVNYTRHTRYWRQAESQRRDSYPAVAGWRNETPLIPRESFAFFLLPCSASFSCCCLSHNFRRNSRRSVLAHDFIRCLLNALSGEKFPARAVRSAHAWAGGRASAWVHVLSANIKASTALQQNWFLKALN